MRIDVFEGNIAAVRADAIVNAANNALWMGSGVAGALRRAGGPSIEVEALERGPIAVGDAIATNAGKLPAKWVIHGAVMGQDLRTDAESIRRATDSCLRLAELLGARSIVFPAFGTGVGGFPVAQCAAIMVRAVRGHVAGSIEHAIFCVFDEKTRRAFDAELAS